MTVLCRVLGVSRSGFYLWLKRKKRPINPEEFCLNVIAKEIFEKSGKTYGSRRMAEALSSPGKDFSRHRARTLMKKLQLKVITSKKYKVTTDSKHSYPVAPNLLNRKFDVSQPNKVWVTDITYIWTHEGWLYLAVVIDLYSRKVVGWSINKTMTTKLVLSALRMAWWQRKPDEGLIHHSDRGSQYASHAYQKELKDYGMVCSMSRKGNCWDNAVAESFFGSLKSERVRSKTYFTRKQAKSDIINYIAMFYNSNRLHSYLNYKSPDKFELVDLAKAA